MLRKKLAVLVAAAMMLFMAASPALAAAGGGLPEGTCGVGQDIAQGAVADEEAGPGASEAGTVPPNACKEFRGP